MYDDHANRVNPDRVNFIDDIVNDICAFVYYAIHFDVHRSLTLVYTSNFFYRLITLKK